MARETSEAIWPGASSLLAPLVDWFEVHRRVLPWRALDLDGLHPDPYGVLVSELMLQQTQVATVVPYFERWMAALPTARDLAEAQDQEVHKLWEGLGYYRRARFLKAAAKAIHQGGWPANLEGLLALPGLGPYTAAALASIAFQQPEPALDGNAFRVLARLLGIEEDPKPLATALRLWLRPALVAHGPSRMTQALMELGATHCGRKSQCESCPLRTRCRALALGRVEQIPPAAPKTKVRTLEITLVAVEAQGCYLVNRPSAEGLLAGLWSWTVLEGDHADSRVAEATSAYPAGNTWPGWTQLYSHRREQVTPLLVRVEHPFSALGHQRWVTQQELQALPMGKRDQRLRERVLGDTPRT